MSGLPAPGDGRDGYFTDHEAGLGAVEFLRFSPREGFGGVHFFYDPATHDYTLASGNATYTARMTYIPESWYKIKIRTDLVHNSFAIWVNDEIFVQDIPYSGYQHPSISFS